MLRVAGDVCAGVVCHVLSWHGVLRVALRWWIWRSCGLASPAEGMTMMHLCFGAPVVGCARAPVVGCARGWVHPHYHLGAHLASPLLGCTLTISIHMRAWVRWLVTCALGTQRSLTICAPARQDAHFHVHACIDKVPCALDTLWPLPSMCGCGLAGHGGGAAAASGANTMTPPLQTRFGTALHTANRTALGAALHTRKCVESTHSPTQSGAALHARMHTSLI